MSPLRKPVLVIVLVAVAAVVSVSGAYYYLQNSAASSNQSSLCRDPGSISSRVYNPYRLQLVKPCITGSGVVENKFEETDGD